MSVVANVAINVDTRGAAGELRKVDDASKQLNKSFDGLKTAVAALGLGLAIKSIADVGNESQKSKIQIQALTAQYGDLGKATESIARIQKVLGISAIDAREGYGQLYAALRSTGVSTQQLEVLFVGLTKAARLSGAGAAEAQGALLQLKQAFASGTLSGDELRSVLETMPAFTAALAKETDALGLTTNATSADIKKLGSEGKITSDILFSAARKLAIANAPGVTSTEQLAAAFKDLQERIAEAFGPAIVQAANTLFGALTGVGNWFKENQGAITAFAKGFLDIAKSVGPIAAGIFIVVKAYQAWQAVSKAVAATQAFIMALTGPKGLAMIAAAAVASAAAYKVLGDVSANVTSEVAKQKAEAEKAKNEFNNIATTVDTIPGKAKLSTDGFKAMAEEAQRGQIAVQAQIASLERGASITAARYDAEKAFNDLQGQQLQRSYDLATSAEQRQQIAIAIFNQQVAAANIERNQALENINLEQRKLELKLEEAKLKRLEIQGAAELAIIEGANAEKKRQEMDKALATNSQLIAAISDQLGAQQQIAEYQKQSVDAQYEGKVLAAQTALEQKLTSDKIGLSQADALRLSDNLARGVSSSQQLASDTGKISSNASSASGNFISLANSAQQAANSINAAVNAQARLNALRSSGSSSSGGTAAPVKKAATGAYWPGGFQAFAKGGMVTKPTLGLVGEGGQPEYIVPQSKASNFARNVLSGRTGASAINSSSGGSGGGGAAPQVSIQTGPVVQMNGTNYVTTQDMSRAVQAGVSQTLAMLRNDRGTRRAVGLA